MEPSHPVDPSAVEPPENTAEQPENTAEQPENTEEPPENTEETAEPEPAAESLPKVWNARSAVLIVLALVMGLVTAGLATGYYLYNKATEPERSTPGIVARQYVYAIFEDRDLKAAQRFTCQKPGDVTDVRTLLTDLEARERRFGIHIVVAWEEFDYVVDGDRATAIAVGRVQVPETDGRVSESLQRWEFSLESEKSAWGICAARRIS